KGLLETSDLDSTRRQVTAWLELAAQQRERVARVRKSWRLEVLDLDLASLREELVRANRSVAPLGWWRARGARRTLASMWASTDRVPVRTVLVGVIDELLECRLGREHLSAAHAGARQVLDSGWRGIDTDETAIRAQLAWSDSFQRVLSRAFSSSGERVGDARSRWIELVTQQRDLLANDGALGRKLRALEDAISVLAAQVSSAARLVSMDESDLVGPADAAGYAARVAEVARGWVSGLPQLRRWCAWRRARAQAMDGGLGAIVAAIEDGRIEPRDVERSFDRSFLEAWLGALFRSDRELGDFSRTAHEDKIRRFRNLDMHVVETAHEVVAARLAARVPRGTMELSGQSTSEMGILHRELGRQRGHTPLRKLLQRIPNVMTRLKPCFLMSPLSVAQYLDVDFPAFDIVVFDEASQIPVWDAVGAIARGTRLIVVGDSRQLPPTNFFGKVDDEELTDESEVQDLDNILDECRVARIPRLELKWHYRSRHESLIAFSNFNYYENRLLTFPSAQLASTNLGVVWRHVPNGVYDRGRSRSNLAEAEAVVAHVVARLEDPTLSAKSIGIVTFSIAQQALVEDLLDEARRTHPSIEPYFSGEREEPVFVKNLENVQGDERDVILFSVCYGPDRDQNVGVNFGPLNRDGGERRLNVAITRARETLVVFSTLRSEQIDLSRSRSIGVRHLKDFLDYAHRGPVALGGGLDVSSLAECESPFEEDVRRTLVERGWEVQPQVGCSGYRVDLGVKDPDAPGRFLLGIECDGAMYHSGKTARDRDRLRQAVLEGLGWRIHRVWSTDWWHAKDEETTRLLAALAESRRPQTDGRNQGEARGGGGGYAQRTLRECAGGCSPIKRGLATPSVEPGRVGWRFPLQGCGCEHAAADHGQSGGVLRDNIRRGNRVADRGRSAYRGAH
ncbi:MAG: DNA helicase, partial [Planctomycetia bacterium]|nr:DNA helicase [Planctomycetia bacterium]